MADVSFFAPDKEADIKRRRRMADAMMKAGEQDKGSEVVSGIVVKKSPLEGLAKALQMGIGGYQAGQADREEAGISKARQEAMAKALQAYQSNPNEAIGMLSNGDPAMQELAMKMGMDERQARQQMDMYRQKAAIDAANQKPSEFQMYSQMSPEQQMAYQQFKGRGVSGGGITTVDPDTGEVIQNYSDKPLPVGALKMQNEGLDAVAAASGTSELAKALQAQADTGQLKLGPVSNMINAGRNAVGLSNPESIAYGTMGTSLEKLRNDTLRLNKGVQTEGDAVRAMNEVIASKNDPKLFSAAMQKLDAVNQRAQELQKLQVNTIRNNYNAQPYNFEQMNALPSPIPQAQNAGQMQQPNQMPPTNAPQIPQGAKQAADGKYYIPDPNRAGKFLMVQ